ncbi:PQQ-binding-like beta-propeller repeat protein [Blastopirellula marina]|uniref:Pyrrolo-quinoline quinone repeat domain-containing protein n=1 Tax=Blastopirellula marina TaxID=124 RepID=A0A2S8F4G3_9BACT|nr:PQQ-binding-like beta-propeller repeat protein [Blastopirellula marina]PQO27046.1 hypothetical protein C5Y98_27710 [Blastopirellula marina]PTL41193.1 hypothetical protein C5Y97_27725 [Blastopirellula marina]
MQIQKLVSRLAMFALVAVAANPAMAQIGARTFSPYELERLGLEKVWSGQLPIDPQRSQLETFRQVISLKDPQVVFEVEHNGKKVTFGSTELDIIGKPLGEEGAKKLVDQYVARLDTSKGEPTVTRREVPNETFFVQSDSGILMSVDGRTGKTNWAELRSNSRFPQTTPDANDDFVVSISGFTLSCLRRDSGAVMWTRQLEGVPIAGPVVGDDFIYIPLLDGTVVAYNFDGGPHLVPRYKSLGRIRMPVISTESSIAWATDRDYFYVGYADRPLVRYRIESSGEIIAPPSNFGPLRLFFTTATGYVYCIYSTDGSIQWRFSCGEPIDSSAIGIDDSVFVTLQRGGMYKLGMEEGDVKWFVPHIKQFLAANEQYAYCLDDGHSLVVLDINSGARVGSMGLQGYDFFYTNAKTDRIIMGTKTGKMVVLRSAALPYPLVHVDVKKPGEKPAPSTGKPGEEGAKPAAEPAVDPFTAPAAAGGGVADPFGAPASSGGSAADPFGSSGGGGGAAADPFGSGSTDPFGNSSGGSDASDPFGSGSGGGASSDDPFN